MKKKSPFTGEIIIDKKNPPVLVYCIGKVGSKTVVNSIHKSSGHNYSVYQVHSLSPKTLKLNTEISANSEFDYTNKSISFNERMNRFFFEYRDKFKWKIITLTRDPVAYSLSSLFEYIDIGILENILPEIYKDKMLYSDFENFSDLFQNKFMLNNISYLQSWFEESFKDAFDIDIFSTPFNQENGFTVISSADTDLLIMRLEDLNRVFPEAMKEFLRVDGIRISNKNIAEKKYFGNLYRFVKSNLVLRKDIAEKVYSNKFSRHFYSDKDITRFINQWTKQKTVNPSDYLKLRLNPVNIFDNIDVFLKKEKRTTLWSYIKYKINLKKNYVSVFVFLNELALILFREIIF